MDFEMDMEWPTKIPNPYEFKMHMDYGFFRNFEPKSLWIMDFKFIMHYEFFMEWI